VAVVCGAHLPRVSSTFSNFPRAPKSNQELLSKTSRPDEGDLVEGTRDQVDPIKGKLFGTHKAENLPLLSSPRPAHGYGPVCLDLDTPVIYRHNEAVVDFPLLG
jgi:hypothetical protein